MTTESRSPEAVSATDTSTSGASRRVLLINGPNLGLLGVRQPEVYGSLSLTEIVADASVRANELNLTLDHLQSDSERVIVEKIATDRDSASALIINAGAFTHYSWAIHDSLAMFPGPIIELHISNPISREAWRHTSVITPVATGVIAGLGTYGYRLAIEAVAHLIRQ